MATKNLIKVYQDILKILQSVNGAAPDLDGGGPGSQAWWEDPCADTNYLGRG